KAGNVGESAAVAVFPGIAAGVSYSHGNGVIHRDLKPQNVLFVRDGNRKLIPAVADFGLGRFTDRDSTTLTLSSVSMGTFEYMPPEQLRGDSKHVDHRGDIYSLGKILYEILTGDLPFPGIDLPKVPASFVYIVERATALRPEDR